MHVILNTLNVYTVDEITNYITDNIIIDAIISTCYYIAKINFILNS